MCNVISHNHRGTKYEYIGFTLGYHLWQACMTEVKKQQKPNYYEQNMI